MKKKTTRKKSKKSTSFKYEHLLLPLILAILSGLGITFIVNTASGEITLQINYSDQGEFENEIPTVEEIDGGGQFRDMLNVEDAEKDLYYELGVIEDVDTSSPEAFKNSTIGRCIVANNYYGAQCVSLARAFWWSYAGYDISTCGTNLAKGIMNCPDTNARDKFKVIWKTEEIQEGTWLVLDGTRTGHICMALSKVTDGYVSCLGENQGGMPCEYGIGGAGTNIINLSVKNFIGGYTPLDYIVPEPDPIPTPNTPDTSIIK